ncbi:MAG: AAA family ATPase [Dehalococcoidales bacterium]|nr:AAA family ATPase [Dehalococcoidales bacterium]
MDIKKYEVKKEQLRVQCDPSMFDFECTSELTPLKEFIGQDRAIRGIEFGLSMKCKGYNIYVAGLSGTGKTSIVKSYVKKMVESRSAEGAYSPDDWCYIYNFTETDKPGIISLPQGRGKAFKEQTLRLLDYLKENLTRAFSSEEYKSQTKNLLQEGQKEQQRLFEEVGGEARKEGFLLQMTNMGPAVIPLVEGKPMAEDVYLALEEDKKKKIEEQRAVILTRLQEVMEKVREAERKTAERVQSIDKAVAEYTVSRLFDAINRDYKGCPQVIEYLQELKTYTLDNLNHFKQPEPEPQPQQQIQAAMGMSSQATLRNDPFLPFQINVFVDNSGSQGPPVITESNPSYLNLFGKIERHFFMGGYLSDHTMLRPGALQKASGGYLLLSAMDVLQNPAVWPTLKRALKDREARIEEPYDQFGIFMPVGLRPQPMPIDVKIILIGDSSLYHMLSAYDEDFYEIFRAKADFDYQVNRTRENVMSYAAFLCGCCEECQVQHFDRSGVARAIDHASRLVSDQEKLSTRFSQMKELVEEAAYWAEKEKSPVIVASHVDRAVNERRYRHNLPDERLREMITRGVIMIDITGSEVGQVNGLSVYSMGDISFGKPSRITCRTYLGRSGVINIERETHLSGPIHDKGVMIFSGYMGWKYAQEYPLSLSASLCFEQSYEGIEGDSASSTELYALLSSLSGLPVKQSMAVTGSVNQKGEIQPIGGINQKIEGFFDVCRARGLSGEQGVLMPVKNLKHLMLRDEVVEAVEKGLFHIWAVDTVDEGISILTGVRAGKKKANGSYPAGTVNYLVDRKLREMADKLRSFAAPQKEGDKSDKAQEG